MKRLLVFALAVISIVTSQAGALDTTFNIGSGANGIVEQVLPLPDGKILICGNFTSFNGKPRAYIARLNGDGSVDESFQAAPGYWVRHMEVQRDGKIVIGGYFTTVGGVSRNLIARLNQDGSLDSSFDPGTGAELIIAGGIDGNIDPFIFWLDIQADGKIVATGNFRNYNGESSMGLVRINPDGSRDRTFNVGSGLNSWGRHVLAQPNGQILVSGWFTSYNNRGYNRMVRINSDGTADTSFNPFFGDKTAIYSVVLQPDGKMIASGHSLNDEGLFKREFARLNVDGSFDPSFVGASNDKTETVLLQPDGKVIIVGSFSQVNNTSRGKLARLFPDGTLDNSLQASIDNFVWGAALQNDGKLLISGGFYTVDGVSHNGVARLNTGLSGGGEPSPPDRDPLLTIAAASSSSQVTINWSDGGYLRTGYVVERKAGESGTYSAVQTLPSTRRIFHDSGLNPATTYFYRIRANKPGGGSLFSNERSVTTLSGPIGPSANKATFAGTDTMTGGTWRGAYGAQGYGLMSGPSSFPEYLTVVPNAKTDWTWDESASDPAALQEPEGSDRLAACWFSWSGLTLDFTFTDTVPHRLSLYMLDWDALSRRQTVEIWDGGNGALLDRRMLSGFSEGVYLSWNVTGKIRVTITPQFQNAVVSGIFIDPPSPSQTPAVSAASALHSTTEVESKAAGRAAFAGTDVMTRGDGQDVYGGDGSLIPSVPPNMPNYATAKSAGASEWIWEGATNDPRAVRNGEGTGRVASCWYSAQRFDFQVDFKDDRYYRVSAYFCDWDSSGRVQTIQILDGASGAVLHETSISDFSGGIYLTWDVQGRVMLRVSRVQGANAVMNGLFFGPSPLAL